MLGPANAGSNTAAYHTAVLGFALEQLDSDALAGEILVRADGRRKPRADRVISAHSEKEQAAGNDKGGYVDPLQAYVDETREALGGLLGPGGAGANTAVDHVTVLVRAVEQIPAGVR